jgi:hypothetical protein
VAQKAFKTVLRADPASKAGADSARLVFYLFDLSFGLAGAAPLPVAAVFCDRS